MMKDHISILSEANARAGVANSEFVVLDGRENSLETQHHVATCLCAPAVLACTPAVIVFNRI